MDFWFTLMELLLLLGAAFVLGTLAERLRQSALLGYLLAGIIFGPLVFKAKAVLGIAELGVALLLFSIGLEFSVRRLRSLGKMALGGGLAQLLGTMLVFGVGFVFLYPPASALVLSAMVALSSTACVLRVLVDRTELDSSRGRNSLGILLFQDIAVVPLMLMTTMLGLGGDLSDLVRQIGRTLLSAVGLGVGFYLLFYHIVPRLLLTRSLSRNSELMSLLAIVVAIGSAGAAHTLHLSPALGAFLAGLLLAESPFATQIRADVGTLRTLFVTLFFISIGMLADLSWIAAHWLEVSIGVAIVLIGKTTIVYAVARYFGSDRHEALSTGITLSQIGEFSFVLATTALTGHVFDHDTFALVVSITIVTLFLAPTLVSTAPALSHIALRRLIKGKTQPIFTDDHPTEVTDRVFIIGFGPAGQQVAETLVVQGIKPIVVEMNPAAADITARLNVATYIGNATHHDVLEHAGIEQAIAVVVTVPDPRTAKTVIQNVRLLAPTAKIIARARYHISRWELEEAGAGIIVDEEEEVGRHLAAKAFECLQTDSKSI